jgi:hypothetical protein
MNWFNWVLVTHTVVLAVQLTESGGLWLEARLDKMKVISYLKNTQHKKICWQSGSSGRVPDSKYKALSSNPSTTKNELGHSGYLGISLQTSGKLINHTTRQSMFWDSALQIVVQHMECLYRENANPCSTL